MIRIARAGNVVGEYEKSDIPALVRAQVIHLNDDYWESGMAGWAKVYDLLLQLQAAANAASAPAPKPTPAPAPSPIRTDGNLISCPDCQKEVSKFAQACPGCGRPMNVQKEAGPQGPQRVITTEDSFLTRSRGLGDIIIFGPLLFIVGSLIFGVLSSCS